MNTGDAVYIKKLNRRILLEEIIKHVSLSRSDLARMTGLNKATVSAQISDLLDEQFIVENKEIESGSLGRKPIMLEINRQAGYSIGIDIDAPLVTILFINLKGETFFQLKVPAESEDLDSLTGQLIRTIAPYMEDFNQQYQPLGIVGIGLAIHGIINTDGEIIFTPNHQWSHINIKNNLEEALQTKVVIDNNANFSAFAEQVYGEHIADLFCVTLYSGIGLGIIDKNEIYRGYQGFAGEIGHMIVESKGLLCSCGNKGCWELYASEKALTQMIQAEYPSLSKEGDISKFIYNRWPAEILNTYLDYLAIGLNNIINIFNPEKIILNGAIINGNSPFIMEIEKKLTSKVNSYREIRASKLGEDSGALGGAAFAIKNFFGVTTIHFANLKQQGIEDDPSSLN